MGSKHDQATQSCITQFACRPYFSSPGSRRKKKGGHAISRLHDSGAAMAASASGRCGKEAVSPLKIGPRWGPRAVEPTVCLLPALAEARPPTLILLRAGLPRIGWVKAPRRLAPRQPPGARLKYISSAQEKEAEKKNTRANNIVFRWGLMSIARGGQYAPLQAFRR